MKKYLEDVFLIFFSGILEKKSKLRNFFEKKKTICIPCYLDNEKDLNNCTNRIKKKQYNIIKRSIKFINRKI